jgi:hypothetical protein
VHKLLVENNIFDKYKQMRRSSRHRKRGGNPSKIEVKGEDYTLVFLNGGKRDEWTDKKKRIANIIKTTKPLGNAPLRDSGVPAGGLMDPSKSNLQPPEQAGEFAVFALHGPPDAMKVAGFASATASSVTNANLEAELEALTNEQEGGVLGCFGRRCRPNIADYFINSKFSGAGIWVDRDFRGSGLCKPMLTKLFTGLLELGRVDFSYYLHNASQTRGRDGCKEGCPACICYVQAGLDAGLDVWFYNHYASFFQKKSGPMRRNDCFNPKLNTVYIFLPQRQGGAKKRRSQTIKRKSRRRRAKTKKRYQRRRRH